MPEPDALHTAEQAAGAVFASRGNIVQADHFGDPAAEYEALTTAAAQLRTIQGVRDVQVKVIDPAP